MVFSRLSWAFDHSHALSTFAHDNRSLMTTSDSAWSPWTWAKESLPPSHWSLRRRPKHRRRATNPRVRSSVSRLMLLRSPLSRCSHHSILPSPLPTLEPHPSHLSSVALSHFICLPVNRRAAHAIARSSGSYGNAPQSAAGEPPIWERTEQN